jgi:2-polyprenyl-3-methyl-5-hydroxy-6-metoxy-1,4-benzoquinol methylase
MLITFIDMLDNKLNNIFLLNKLKNLCFTTDDVRACWIADYDLATDYHEFTNIAKWSKEHYTMYKAFFNDIDKTSNITILDAGCGNGYNTKMISNNFPNAQVVGVELNTDCINFAKEYNKSDKITYIQENLFLFNTPERYNYIFFLEVLEHISADNHFEIIDKLLQLLTDDGLLFISTPNELDNPDCYHGHIGLLNRLRTKKLIERYSNNMIKTQFYDNKLLLTDNYIIDEPIETYENSSWGVGGIEYALNKSNFKLTYKK